MLIDAIDGYLTLLGVSSTAFFFVFSLLQYFRGNTGKAVLSASFFTLLAFLSKYTEQGIALVQLFEALSLSLWAGVATRILGVSRTTFRQPGYERQFQLTYIALAIALATLASVLVGIYAKQYSHSLFDSANAILACKTALSLIGLVLIEQLYRNTRRDYQWNMKFMSLGLVLIFGYEFIMHAQGMMFGGVDATLYKMRGAVYSFASVFLMIASGRNQHNVLNINLSRDFVFRSGALILAGAYLVIISIGGYYLRSFGGEWGEVLQGMTMVAAFALVVLIGTSTRIRNHLKVVIDKNLFEYKYDYRNEWRQITDTLTKPDADLSLGQRVVLSLANILHCRAGVLWVRDDNGAYNLYATVGAAWRPNLTADERQSLEQFIAQNEWVVDLDEYRERPSAYMKLTIGKPLLDRTDIRFIVPLLVNNDVFGIVLLGQPEIQLSLIWEDYDVLKVAARQAASVLAQHESARALSDARQFQAFHQMSAFVVHDIKTVVAQLSLMVRNGERHKSNPVFIDDMLATTDHASKRMQKLLDQLKNPETLAPRIQVDLVAITKRVVERQRRMRPEPSFACAVERADIVADEERLGTAIGHIVQNAQEATAADGEVSVSIGMNKNSVEIVVTDNGAGMDESFVRDRLFAPFDSTKGLSGMGIGVFQSREYVRACGGDIQVESVPGKGSTFVLSFPLSKSSVRTQTNEPTSPRTNDELQKTPLISRNV